MTRSVHLGNCARFMGFRDCPACGETLFAASRAEFVRADRVILQWRCDTCGYGFETIADTRGGAAGARRLSDMSSGAPS
jgi:predicted RNA-binding Zn-ribbon protein involved in translation (DUF1610 family)